MVTRDEILRLFPHCGSVEGEFENSKWFSVFMQLVFTAAGLYFFWLMMGEASLSARLDNIAVVCFCLWRIHRQRDVICFMTSEGLVVRRQFMSMKEFFDEQFHEERSFAFVPYRDIFSISDSWQAIELGQAEEGGIAVLPVHLQFLSKKSKQRIIDRVREWREEHDG